MRLSRPGLLVSLLYAAACASSGSTATTPASTVVQNTMPIIGDNAGAGNSLRTTTTIITATTTTHPYTADQVFSVLNSVYEEIKITVTTIVTNEHIIGNPDFRTRRAIGPLQMRRLLDCGGTTGEPNADTFEIFMSVLSEVKADGAHEAVLATVFQANGRPVAFPGSDVRCTSTGELEGKIASLTKLKLAQLR